MINYIYYAQGTTIKHPSTEFLWRWDGKQMALTSNHPNDWVWSRCKPKHFKLSLSESDAKLFFPKATL